jgi:large subunit ribosomal protein L21
MDMSAGNTIELDRVLLIADDDNITVGTPTVEGAKVIATSQGEEKGKKVIVFKYKPKVRYRKKTGHRQLYTRLSIDKIIGPEATQPKPAKKTRKRKSEVKESGS